MADRQDRNKQQPGASTAKADGLRERKKKATRELISDIATRLFAERGFEQVTVEEVAAAANISKMTVFNYFARKEDLFFDRSDEAQQLAAAALLGRGHRPPITALRALAHELVQKRHPITTVDAIISTWWQVVANSPALRARVRELCEELERDLTEFLSRSVGAPAADPTARLVTVILIGAWRVAFREALLHHASNPHVDNSQAFLALLERGFAAATTAAEGSPYV